jgi:hypothetical protein
MLKLLAPLALISAAPAAAQRIEAVDRVWAGHPVPFALVTTAERIYVGYYDAARQLSVASRPLGASWWTYTRLPSWTGWDSHNGIAMAVDAAGQLHVAANMHNDPLVYFRTTSAGDVRTLTRVPLMADAAAERSMTDPVFLKDGEGRLIFKYRDGGSGRGREIYNVLDGERWQRLTDAPLVDGEGKRSAYFVGPVQGPDGWFHLSWVWRDTPDAATNHDLSYARSRDLVRWTRSDGTPLPLPIRLGDAEVVDPVPVRGGMINNNTPIGFDSAARAVIAFHKYDGTGNTQVYVARRAAKGWRVAQASDWSGFRWEFHGMGSLDFRLRVAAPVAEGNMLRVPIVRDGKPIDLLVNGATLARIGERPGADRLAARLSVPAGMQLNRVEDASGIAIAWATLPPRRDVPREDVPEPQVLRLMLPDKAAAKGHTRVTLSRTFRRWRGLEKNLEGSAGSGLRPGRNRHCQRARTQGPSIDLSGRNPTLQGALSAAASRSTTGKDGHRPTLSHLINQVVNSHTPDIGKPAERLNGRDRVVSCHGKGRGASQLASGRHGSSEWPDSTSPAYHPLFQPKVHADCS